MVLFEGRDAAGKGGVIKRITDRLNPRVCRVVALGTPNDREKTQWYFQRYVSHLPSPDEIVLFDRSWYNRAGVERVMGFCSEQETQEFFRSFPEFERMLVRSGIFLVKYWFSISDEEQEARFQKRLHDPKRRWKLSPIDVESRMRWIEYSKAKDAMFAQTHIEEAPSYVVKADNKRRARLNCIHHLLSLIPYEAIDPPEIALKPRPARMDYERPPIDEQPFIPESTDRSIQKLLKLVPNLLCGHFRCACSQNRLATLPRKLLTQGWIEQNLRQDLDKVVHIVWPKEPSSVQIGNQFGKCTMFG